MSAKGAKMTCGKPSQEALMAPSCSVPGSKLGSRMTTTHNGNNDERQDIPEENNHEQEKGAIVSKSD
jgi:hypothetical protein